MAARHVFVHSHLIGNKPSKPFTNGHGFNGIAMTSRDSLENNSCLRVLLQYRQKIGNSVKNNAFATGLSPHLLQSNLGKAP